MESVRNGILTCLIERAPNTLTAANILALVGGTDAHALKVELEKMVEDGVLVTRKHARNADFALPSYEGLPIREYVSVSGIKVPRLLADDTPRPEELNIFFEVLARRMLEIETETERKLDERLKSYWANVVTLFGAFIGVFSLIVGFLKVVPIETGATFTSVLLLSSAQVIPLALVLGAFVLLLKRLFK